MIEVIGRRHGSAPEVASDDETQGLNDIVTGVDEDTTKPGDKLNPDQASVTLRYGLDVVAIGRFCYDIWGVSAVVFTDLWALILFQGGYLALEAMSGLLKGDTLGGWWAAEVYGSIQTERTGVWDWAMLVHVCSSVLFWLLAAIQIYGKGLRLVWNGWPHRVLGYITFGIFFVGVGPTSAYLSIFLAVGYWSALNSIVFLEATVLSSYYMWRAFKVIRVRRRGSASVLVHARLAQAGTLLSAVIILQRGILIAVYGVRLALQFFGRYGPLSLHNLVELILPSHDACVTLSVLCPGIIFLPFVFLDDAPALFGYVVFDDPELASLALVRIQRAQVFSMQQRAL